MGKVVSLPPNENLGRMPLDRAHWVTYLDDGKIERRIFEKGGEVPISMSREEVKAGCSVFRESMPGKEHIVLNVGPTQIRFSKSLTTPELVRPTVAA